MSAARGKTREERLFSASVLRRTLELSDPAHRSGFAFVYEGVLRDLGVTDDEVRDFLAAHGPDVDLALGRGRGAA